MAQRSISCITQILYFQRFVWPRTLTALDGARTVVASVVERQPKGLRLLRADRLRFNIRLCFEIVRLRKVVFTWSTLSSIGSNPVCVPGSKQASDGDNGPNTANDHWSLCPVRTSVIDLGSTKRNTKGLFQRPNHSTLVRQSRSAEVSQTSRGGG